MRGALWLVTGLLIGLGGGWLVLNRWPAPLGTPVELSSPSPNPGEALPLEPQETEPIQAATPDGFFQVQVGGCRYQEAQIQCLLVWRNQSRQEIKLTLAGAIAFTDQGLQLTALELSVGAQRGKKTAAQTTLPNLDTPVTILLDATPTARQAATKLVLLRLRYTLSRPDQNPNLDLAHELDLRDIPITSSAPKE